MKKTLTNVSNPSKTELLTLRLMIFIGEFSMFYLLYNLFGQAQVGYTPFYWILMLTICFSCLRILHEWYHYFAISVPVIPTAGKTFTVDIFTTFCAGEPHEMVEATLEAIQKISYPHTTYLCDEADDPYLREVCRRLNVHHIARDDHKDAKAGNINHALQFATGELCVILDPDHVPDPGFLDPIIAHFNDPGIGFVQIVQAYYNLGETFIAKGAAQQTFQFYGPIMMTMNSYGTVQAIGANCTFRREALDSIGGHAAGLAEDMHTALKLHAAGWSSVYVPAVLARGLVPSSLSAYYAQQLKWARGTFEIFFTSYLHSLAKLSWRQKIHYGTVPLYYLSGFVVLINLMIPVLSLCTGLIPFRVDFVEFLLLGMPMIASTVLIRHYVQRWVMEEKERGFHVIGGLLQIGTWWIYILGFAYTLVRKKVPYIPTPKRNTGNEPWALNFPNLLMIAVSLTAIVFGLYNDWNPYSLVMAGIAGVNCAILATVVLMGRANDDVKLRDRYSWINKGLAIPLMIKRKFWLLRHTFIYSSLRKLGLLLLALTVFAAWYFLRVDSRPPSGKSRDVQRPSDFYTGLFQPGATEGLVSIEEVSRFESLNNGRFNIISLYVPWGDSSHCFLQDSLINKIYANGSLPMITWEPWAALFRQTQKDESLKKEQKIFSHLVTGVFDQYLETFAGQVKKINKPIFIRFAHEPDNPAYPWSMAGLNTAEEYKAGWKYVYEYFLRHGVNNVVWVWSPWKAGRAADYFPGKAYVDWLSVTALDYGALSEKKTSYSFRDLYAPFHQLDIFRSGMPVMVGEMGSLADQSQQTAWFRSAFRSIDKDFPEIRATIFFNSTHDRNMPLATAPGMLDWKWKAPDSVLSYLKQYPRMDSSRKVLPWAELETHPASAVNHRAVQLPSGIRGMNYNTGKTWYRNFHDLTRRRVNNDLEEMRSIGITTIRRYGPGIYDRNVLKAAAQTGMKVMYSFWTPSVEDSKNDRRNLSDAKTEIIRTVRHLKDQPHIIAWSVGNTAQYEFAGYQKPASLYAQAYFLNWLNELTREIKSIDSTRPVTIDIRLEAHLEATIALLRSRMPFVDGFGLVIGNDTSGISQIDRIDAPVFISEIAPRQVAWLKGLGHLPVFIKEFQDQQTRDFITFDGVTDHWGRRKPGYYIIRSQWTNSPMPAQLPQVKILRPAKTVFGNRELTYCALVDTGDGWRFPGNAEKRFRFEWHLVKTGEDGESVYMRHLGAGATIKFNVPEDPERYRLYLQLVDGNNVDGAQSILNLPLIRQ